MLLRGRRMVRPYLGFPVGSCCPVVEGVAFAKGVSTLKSSEKVGMSRSRWSWKRFKSVAGVGLLAIALSGCGETGVEFVLGPTEDAEELRVVLEETGALAVHSMTLADGTPLTGAGLILAAWEPGVPYPHPDFASRLTVVEDGGAGASDSFRKHATKIGGTLVGDGSGTADDGGAPVVTGFAPAAGYVAVEAPTYGSVNHQSERIESILTGGDVSPVGLPIDAANFSYTSVPLDCAAPYGATAALWDAVVARTSAVLVRSAGNNGQPGLETGTWSVVGYPTGRYYTFCPGGWKTVNGESLAKNIIAVGATSLDGQRPNFYVCNQPVDDIADCPCLEPPPEGESCVRDAQQTYLTWPFEGPDQVGDRLLRMSSSRGPASDGRIKPDLVGWGSALDYVTADASSYSQFGQTSFSSAQVAGVGGLVIQKYRGDLGVRPSASMVRALLLHSAVDQGWAGPDYFYGWGAVDAVAAVRLVDDELANDGTRLHSVTLSPGEDREYEFFVDERPSPPYGPARDPGMPGVLRITAAWTDPPGAVGGPKALVNDIDISLVDPSGTVIYPWVLPYARTCRSAAGCDSASIPLPADRGINETDNVEQIVYELPEEVHGVFTLRVHHRIGVSAQTVSLVTNHDVFLPTPTARWEICGDPCAADRCCSIAELGSEVSCDAITNRCTLTRSRPLGSSTTLRMLGHSEAGLYIVEGYDRIRPDGASKWAWYQRYYVWQTPQPGGSEVKEGAASSTHAFLVPGTYELGGRVRSRVSAYVLGTQGFPVGLVINVE